MAQVIINTQKCEITFAWLIKMREKSEWLIIGELFAPNTLLAKPCRRDLAGLAKDF